MKPEDKQTEDASAQKPASEAAKSSEEPKKDAGKYVFKILPANPKNAFDFEDVADK